MSYSSEGGTDRLLYRPLPRWLLSDLAAGIWRLQCKLHLAVALRLPGFAQ